MSKIDTFKQTVEQMVDALGGQANIKEAFHCATRFRVIVNDDAKVNKQKLENVEKSKGFSKEGQQWQIIFGAGVVNKVYDKYLSIYKIGNQNNSSSEKKEKLHWNPNYSIKTNIFIFLRQGIRSFADIFIPLIPVFIAGGLSLALNSLICVEGIGKNSAGEFLNPAAQISSKLFDTIGGAILGSLPVFIGYTAAKKWGGSGWMGACLGLILIAPGLINSYTLGGAEIRWYSFINEKVLDSEELAALYPIADYPDLWKDNVFQAKDVAQIPVLWTGSPRIFDVKYPIFGIPLMGYQAQVIPTLMVIILAVQIEKFMKKISHESIAIISVPLVTVVVSTILAFVVIGPIGYMLSLAIAEGLKAIFIYTNFPGFGLGGAILGAVYAPIVVTGLHQGFLPIEAQLLASGGESWITPIACVSNVSQAFACLAAAIYLKNKSKKSTAYSGALSANLGITEPALFGININVRHFFIAGIIGSAVGGYWLGMTQTTANSLGSASWIGLIQFDVSMTENLQAWYDKVSSLTPWGKYMTSLGMPPIANAAIAMTMASLVSFVMANVLSWTKMGRNNLIEVNKTNEMPKFISNIINKMSKNKQKQIVSYVYAPISGTLYLPKNMKDTVFDEEMMGKSFAIKSNESTYNLSSTMKHSKIASVFDTGHAITITNKNNNSTLIHIGLDTAKLNLDVTKLDDLKYFKFKKKILSSVSVSKKSSTIVEVQNDKLISSGAKDNKVFVSLLNESLKPNQVVNVIAKEGKVEKGQPIFKIVTTI